MGHAVITFVNLAPIQRKSKASVTWIDWRLKV